MNKEPKNNFMCEMCAKKISSFEAFERGGYIYCTECVNKLEQKEAQKRQPMVIQFGIFPKWWKFQSQTIYNTSYIWKRVGWLGISIAWVDKYLQ
ncbi:MAG: hypothetical protein V4478_03270 [Patescibacteria group bacterium]